MNIQVGVVMGSTSDWETMQHACTTLEELGIAYEKKVLSCLLYTSRVPCVKASTRRQGCL